MPSSLLVELVIVRILPVCPNDGISHVSDIPGGGNAVEQTHNLFKEENLRTHLAFIRCIV